MHETVDIYVLERGGTRTVGEYDAQHIALVRAPTNARGSGGEKSAFVDETDGASRTFSVRLAENIELPRDTLDEGMVDRCEYAVRVLVFTDNMGV